MGKKTKKKLFNDRNNNSPEKTTMVGATNGHLISDEDNGRTSPTRMLKLIHVWAWITVYLQHIVFCINRAIENLKVQIPLIVSNISKVPKKRRLQDGDFGPMDIEIGKLRSEKKHKIYPKFQKVTTFKHDYWTETLPLEPPLPVSQDATTAINIPDNDPSTLILNSASETRIITTVFEVSGAGLGMLLADMQDEMDLWFQENGLLVACSELVWSVPIGRRDPSFEFRMKDNLFRALRGNNRRVLNQPSLKQKCEEPLILPESVAEEVSGRESSLGVYQGIYRRYYANLLPYRHHDAADMHSGYWEFNNKVLKPEPAKFMMGSNRRVEELSTNCLVAINLVVLKI